MEAVQQVIRRPDYFLTGDFSIPHCDWDALNILPGAEKQFHELSINNQFAQSVDRFTYFGSSASASSCLDLVCKRLT